MIVDARSKGLLKGIRVTDGFSLTHILFVDDVLIFCRDAYLEWSLYYDIIRSFCNASGMEINPTKFSFITVDGLLNHRIHGLFPFTVRPLEEGFKYLGFTLKPNCYGKLDWLWML